MQDAVAPGSDRVIVGHDQEGHAFLPHRADMRSTSLLVTESRFPVGCRTTRWTPMDDRPCHSDALLLTATSMAELICTVCKPNRGQGLEGRLHVIRRQAGKKERNLHVLCGVKTGRRLKAWNTNPRRSPRNLRSTVVVKVEEGIPLNQHRSC